MSTDPSSDDKELFARIAEGDEKAFTELFHLYTPRLLPFVIKLTRNDQQGKEIIQETFLRLWTGRAQLINVNDPAAWIFRIASNVSITWLRTQGRQKRKLLELQSREAADLVPTDLETKELGLFIHRAVDALPEQRKRIYQLSREKGLTHQQIANQLDISPNTVKNQIGIALKFIQEFIHKETGLSIITLAFLLSL